MHILVCKEIDRIFTRSDIWNILAKKHWTDIALYVNWTILISHEFVLAIKRLTV